MRKIYIFVFIVLLPYIGHSQTLNDIKRRGVLRVALTKSGANTVNKLIAEEFAKFLDVKYEEVPISWEEVFSKDGVTPEDYQTNKNVSYTPDALKKADIICGTIYIRPWRKKFFNYSGIVQVSDLLIVRKRNGKDITSYEDLKGKKIAFLKNSSYETNIELINKDPKVNGEIKYVKTSSEDEALELLKNKKVDGLITVSYLALHYIKENSRDFKLAFPVATPQNVGWAIRKGSKELKNEIENFFETAKGVGRLDELFRKKYQTDYSTYIEIINSYAQSQRGTKTRDFDDIVNSGKIVIALRDRDMVYHEFGKQQFSHHLAVKFAEFLGLQIEIKITPKFSNYFEDDNGIIAKDSIYMPKWFNEFDVACDLIAPLSWRLKKVDVIDYMPNAMVVIGRKDTKISSINDLSVLEGVTSKGSSYEHALNKNNINKFHYNSGNNFFKEVISGKADYTISNIAVFDLADFPQLEAKFIIGEISKMGWAIKKNQPKLRQKILEFFENAKENGILDDYFKDQTGMTMKAADKYLKVLHETYQEGYFPFVFYGTEEGLPQEDVLSIFQDNQGYMWFGTHAGAVKYNGRKMVNYNTDSGLSNNTIHSIKQDNKNKIYFITLNGVSILNPRTGKIKSYLKGSSFRDVYIDKNNEKYFYGENGIFKLSGRKEISLNDKIDKLPKKIHSLSKNKENGDFVIASSNGLFFLGTNKKVTKVSNEYCHYALFDSDGNLFVSMQSGLYYADKRTARKKQIGKRINDIIGLDNVIVRQIRQTSDGSIWLTSDYKIVQLLTLKQKPIVYNSRVGMKNYQILSSYIDNEGIFWFGYSGGLQKLTNKSLRTLFPEFLNSHVNSIFEDKESKIWFGLNNSIYTLKEKLENFSNSLDLRKESFTITQLVNNNILIANQFGMNIIENKNGKTKVIKKIKFKKPLFKLENIFVSKKNEIFLMTGGNGIVYYLKNFDSTPVIIENQATRLISQIEQYKDKIIGGNNTGLVVFKDSTFERLLDLKSQVWSLCKDYKSEKKEIQGTNRDTIINSDILWVGTQNGLGIFENGTFKEVNPKLLGKTVINSIEPAEDRNKIWLGTNNGVIYYDKVNEEIEFIIDSKDGLPGNEVTINGLFLDGRGLLWIGTYHGPATFDIKKKKLEKHTPTCLIESIQLNGKKINNLPKSLNSRQNNITIEISGLSFKDENSVEYEFYLQGLENDYEASRGKDNIAKYTNLPPGKYSFKYRTKGKDGIWSYYNSINFTIEKPIYLEWWFLISTFVILILSIWILFKWRMKILKKRNELLELTVQERTIEISEQNKELETQKEEIQAQRDASELARNEIEEQKKEIEDSILYAKRIQNAILPPTKFINEILPDNFILFKPRDIVSGDFYWFGEKGDSVYFAAVDCTGHGVPGAFMSMLGTSFLNEILKSADYEIEPSVILDRLRQNIIKALHQTGRVHEAKDGMDIALCKINKNKTEVEFAGAFNPLYRIRDGEITVVNPDRMPIGIYEYEDDKKNFTNNVLKIQEGDLLYVFSDGYPDQFGGPKGKKFMIGRFKKLLLKVSPQSMEKQHQFMDDMIEKWRKGISDQIDDILVIGVKV